MTALPNFALALPEIFLILAGLVFLMFGVIRERDSTHGLTIATIVAMVVAGVLITRMHGASATTFNGLFW